jgi:hypothetical protein
MRTRKNGFGLSVALHAALFCFGFTANALAQDEPAPPPLTPSDDAATPADTTAPAPEPAPAPKAEAKAEAQAKVVAPAVQPAPTAAQLPAAELEREKAVSQVGVEILPGSGYPEPRVRGIKYGSLWLTMQGYQWPYMPWSPGRSSTVLAFSGSMWADVSYAHITTGNDPSGRKTQPNLKRWAQQSRAVLRATPTYSNAQGWFAQGQAEIVGQGTDATVAGGVLGQIDDLYVRVGKWNLFDITAGRYQGWEVYHYGMGLDLNTLERSGADDPGVSIHPVPNYGVDYFWDRPSNGPGNYALHVYPTDFLRFEVLGQIGTFAKRNLRAIRPVAILDLGFIKAKVAYEYGKSIPQPDHGDKTRDSRNGIGGALQFVLNPYIEGGVSAAVGYVDSISAEGIPQPGASNTTRTIGGFVNGGFGPKFPLVLGVGIHQTHWHDLQKNGNPPPDINSGKSTEQDHFQSFFAVQYTLFERFYIKFVGSHANFRYYDYAHTPSKLSTSQAELGGRLRLMMLF